MTRDSNYPVWEDYFYLDATSETGIRWAVFNRAINPSSQKFPGDVAGFKKRDKNGNFSYYRVKVNGKNFAVHRIVWEMYNERKIPDGYVINHKDCDTFNNSVDNLEVCLQKHNMRRRKDHIGTGTSKANTTGYTGVSLDRKENKLRGTVSYYYKAFYSDELGKIHSKCFSIRKYGEEEALALAVQWRKEQMALLVALDIGYT